MLSVQRVVVWYPGEMFYGDICFSVLHQIASIKAEGAGRS